jgi:hypothetical protein
MVHGHAAQLELSADGLKQTDGRAWTDVAGARNGWGATFQLEGRGAGGHFANVIFHFAVPTPALVTDPQDGRTYRAHLASIGVQGVVTSRMGAITFIDAWERHNRIYTTRNEPAFAPGLGLGGDFRDRWDTSLTNAGQQNVFQVHDRPTVWGGLGISLGFQGTVNEDARMTITVVGAEFVYVPGP